MKLVIPAAGEGSRMFYVTLGHHGKPKELVYMGGVPALIRTIKDALEAGIHDVVLVSSHRKTALVEMFTSLEKIQRAAECESNPVKRDEKLKQVETLLEVGTKVNYTVVYQNEPLGLGHAVLQARAVIGDEPFAVALPDDHFLYGGSSLKLLMDRHNQSGLSNLILWEVPWAQASSYGIASGEKHGDVVSIAQLAEKPSNPSSNMAVIGRYLLNSSVMERLHYNFENKLTGKNGEYQLTDALEYEMNHHGLEGVIYRGVRHDTGHPEGLIRANNAFWMDQNPEMMPGIIEVLSQHCRFGGEVPAEAVEQFFKFFEAFSERMPDVAQAIVDRFNVSSKT